MAPYVNHIISSRSFLRTRPRMSVSPNTRKKDKLKLAESTIELSELLLRKHLIGRPSCPIGSSTLVMI